MSVDEHERPDLSVLTPEERTIARHVRAGRSADEIAVSCGISEARVERHLSDLMTKLDLRSEAELRAWARESDEVARLAREDAPSRVLDWLPEAGALSRDRRTSGWLAALVLAVTGVVLVLVLSRAF